MKKALRLLPVLTFFLIFGCTPTEKKADVPPPPTVPEGQAAPAPAPVPPQPESSGQIIENYATGLTGTLGRAKGAQVKEDLEEINMAVRNFQSENERYPSSLDEIKGSLRANVDLGRYNYDPATGNVTIK